MDIESRVQKIELECAEVKRALSDLKADHDELRLMAVEIATIKKDIQYVLGAQTKMQSAVSKIVYGIFIAIAAQVIQFMMAGGFVLGQ